MCPKHAKKRGAHLWDVFISPAHEDKAEIAKPLAEALRAKGLRIWYDEFSLRLGDSLRQSIDLGLLHSRYGVVVLSPHFFQKHWPTQELNALAGREANGKNIIIPIWHKVGYKRVSHFSPVLADRFAIQTSRGIPAVVTAVLAAVTPLISRAKDAALAGTTAELARLRAEAERNHDLTLELLGDALDLKEPNR